MRFTSHPILQQTERLGEMFNRPTPNILVIVHNFTLQTKEVQNHKLQKQLSRHLENNQSVSFCLSDTNLKCGFSSIIDISERANHLTR